MPKGIPDHLIHVLFDMTEQFPTAELEDEDVRFVSGVQPKNPTYRNGIAAVAEAYKNAKTSLEKHTLAYSVVEAVRAEGGRFVEEIYEVVQSPSKKNKKIKTKDIWFEVGDEVAIKKIEQRIRDRDAASPASTPKIATQVDKDGRSVVSGTMKVVKRMKPVPEEEKKQDTADAISVLSQGMGSISLHDSKPSAGQTYSADTLDVAAQRVAANNLDQELDSLALHCTSTVSMLASQYKKPGSEVAKSLLEKVLAGMDYNAAEANGQHGGPGGPLPDEDTVSSEVLQLLMELASQGGTSNGTLEPSTNAEAVGSAHDQNEPSVMFP